MERLLIFLYVSILSLSTFSQEHAWVYLKNKPNETTYLEAPLLMLSQRALDRRTSHDIDVDTKDVPIETSYYTQIKNASGITVLAKSKWLNAIHVLGEVSDINDLTSNLDFIESIEFANNDLNSGVSSKETSKTIIKHQNKFENTFTDFDYGNATNQIEMLGGDTLHEAGFTGEGMHVAVIDAGFPNVNTLDAFSRIRDNNQILGGYDFVDRSENFYGGSSHGTNVLSDIAGYVEGEFVGTAPDASFYLFRTEDGANETPLEESLWVEAAERADSLGVNIINTSLGYTTFDNSDYDYSYADMDGETTFISRGASVGASRGMLLVNSAGNSGASAWKYIGAPADVENVFSIGAVNANEEIASFSSFGPTVDGRIKPDVLAQGLSAYVISSLSGAPLTSSGTSFSSPIIAGIVACFWQAFPDKTNLEIMQLIRESADRYTNPTEQHGFGIPDFSALYARTVEVNDDVLFSFIDIYPNPVVENLTIFSANNSQEVSIYVYNLAGRQVINKTSNKNTLDVSDLKAGMYLLKLIHKEEEQVFKFLKK